MPYQMYLILNHIQYLALSKQNQILTYGGPKYLQKRNNEDFFVHLLNAWLHHTNNNFPHVCKRSYWLIHIFKSTIQTGFLCSIPGIPPRNISDKITIFLLFTSGLFRCLQHSRGLFPCLISSTTLTILPLTTITEYKNLLWT